MHTVSPLVFQHASRIVALLALAAIVLVVLGLLAYAVMLWAGIHLPSLDGPELAPFRWSLPETVA